jgi:hypothetical protein
MSTYDEPHINQITSHTHTKENKQNTCANISGVNILFILQLKKKKKIQYNAGEGNGLLTNLSSMSQRIIQIQI